MRRMSYRSLFVGIAFGSSLAGSSVAFAQAVVSPEKPLAESLHDEAKEAYTSAKLLFRNDDFAAAAAKFAQAYGLAKDPRLLFDKAICERNLRAYARMRRDLETYEEESGPGISAEHKAAAEEALAAIKNFVGSVTLKVNVEGAGVTVDGEGVGQTPLRAPLLLDLGKHDIEVFKAGFASGTQVVDVEGGDERSVTIALIQEVHAGRLLVAAEPASSIFVDGVLAGTARFEAPLAPGPHDVKVTEPGKRAYETQIELRDGEMRTMQVTLQGESHRTRFLPWIVGGAVVVACAVTGGYFLLKPQDETVGVPKGTLAAGGGDVHFMAWRGP